MTLEKSKFSQDITYQTNMFDFFVEAAVTPLNDKVAPRLISSSPADDSFAVGVGRNIVLRFDEKVKKGNGTISIKDYADNSVEFSFAVSDPAVTFKANKVTIDPPSNLAFNKHYYLTIDDTAITDKAGNAFSGIKSKEGLDFTTIIKNIDLAELDKAGTVGVKGFAINGSSYSYGGVSVSSAGDINGDGFDDLMIGARGDAFQVTPGKAYVLYGSNKNFNTNINLDSAEFSFATNPFTDPMAGRSVGAGDFNGDGINDLMIGVTDTILTDYLGASYVIYGEKGKKLSDVDLTNSDINNKTQGIKIAGGTTPHVGYSVSSAGDINGDGFDDMVMAAPGTIAGTHKGVAYFVFGNDFIGGENRNQNIDLGSLGDKGFKFTGTVGDGLASVSDLGDVNGDGYDDVLLGASFSNYLAGTAYVLYGKAGGFVDLTATDMNGVNGSVLNGAPYSASGISVGGAGDFNGDGINDLIIGALQDDSAYLVFGSKAGFGASLDLSSLKGSAGMKISSNDNSTMFDFGRSVSSAGDFNGDGYDDIIIGESEDPTGPHSGGEGAAYVIFGKASGFKDFNVDKINGRNGFKISGVAANDKTGFAVSSAGDINGDGYDDIMVGAPMVGDDQAGTTYVIYGDNVTDSVTLVGDTKKSKADTLTGTKDADIINAGKGKDTIYGLGGADAIQGGSGRDKIVIKDLAVRHIDGGSGVDTLSLSGKGLKINLSQDVVSGATDLTGKLESIEVIKLTGKGNNSLDISATSLLSLSETSNTLKVIGNKGDVVNVHGGSWTDDSVSSGFQTWHDGEAVLVVGVNTTVNFI